MLPEAFDSTRVVPCAATTSESSRSKVCIVYESVPSGADEPSSAVIGAELRTAVRDFGVTVIVVEPKKNSSPATTHKTTTDAAAHIQRRDDRCGGTPPDIGGPSRKSRSMVVGAIAGRYGRGRAGAWMLRMPRGAASSIPPSSAGGGVFIGILRGPSCSGSTGGCGGRARTR